MFPLNFRLAFLPVAVVLCLTFFARLLMSSFQLNLSNLTLGAKERIARLDAAGGAFRSLLSPPPLGVAAAVASGTPPPVSAAGSASGLHPAPPLVPGGRLSVEQLVSSGAGLSG